MNSRESFKSALGVAVYLAVSIMVYMVTLVPLSRYLTRTYCTPDPLSWGDVYVLYNSTVYHRDLRCKHLRGRKYEPITLDVYDAEDLHLRMCKTCGKESMYEEEHWWDTIFILAYYFANIIFLDKWGEFRRNRLLFKRE